MWVHTLARSHHNRQIRGGRLPFTLSLSIQGCGRRERTPKNMVIYVGEFPSTFRRRMHTCCSGSTAHQSSKRRVSTFGPSLGITAIQAQPALEISTPPHIPRFPLRTGRGSGWVPPWLCGSVVYARISGLTSVLTEPSREFSKARLLINVRLTEAVSASVGSRRAMNGKENVCGYQAM